MQENINTNRKHLKDSLNHTNGALHAFKL